MAKQSINVGTTANDKKGDSLRAAFQKVNANFTELYTALGLNSDGTLNLGAFEFTGSTLSTTDSTAIVIDQATTVTSNLTVGGDLIPQIANGGNLGSIDKPWRSLYVSNNTVFLGGVPLSLEAGTNELRINNVPVSQTITFAEIPDAPTVPADISDLTDTEGLLGGVTSYNELTDKPTLFSGSYNDLTNKPSLASTYQFSVAADDSTQRLISSDELIKFVGAGGITTASDAEGNITISKTSELVSATVPTVGSTASAGEAGITYSNKIAIFTEGAFTEGVWTDVQPGWTVTDNNGFTDTIASRGGFGAASFVTTVNNWPAPASGKTYVFTSPGYQLGYTNPIEITVGNNDWTFDNAGSLTLPASGIITTEDDEFFKLQAKDVDSALRNEIKLDPNNGTYMSVWSEELSRSFSTSDWATASWQNNNGQGYAIITNAEDLADFWTTYDGSFVDSVEVSINGGARTPVTYYGDNEEQYDVELSINAVPGSTTAITSLVFYYRTKNSINIDYNVGEILLDAQALNIKLQTTADLNLESGQYLNLKSTGSNTVRIYTDNPSGEPASHIWEFNTTGSLTLPREGKIYGVGLGAAGDRAGYISWDGDSSGDGLGYNTMRLVPDLQGLEDAHTYIILDPAYVDGETGSIHIRAGGTRDNSLANLCLGGANSQVKIGAGANPPVTVKANNYSWTFDPSGALTIPGDIQSENDISIRVNLTDSTTRIWRFGEDGNLTFPDGTNYSGNDITVPSGGVPTGIANLNSNGGWNTPPYTNLATTGGTGSGLTVNATSNAGNGYLDTIAINTAGTGYTDGDVITITNENSLTATFTISTSHTWTLNTNGRTTFPNGVVPAHSYGAAGDKEGMVVFDDTYIYYCTADYVDNVTDIWKRTAHGAGTW
jgi:hypothetical protein